MYFRPFSNVFEAKLKTGKHLIFDNMGRRFTKKRGGGGLCPRFITVKVVWQCLILWSSGGSVVSCLLAYLLCCTEVVSIVVFLHSYFVFLLLFTRYYFLVWFVKGQRAADVYSR